MKARTGKECKKVECLNHDYYLHWFRHLGSSALGECINCKHAHVSQYRPAKKEAQQ
jgi:hypothetical protein